MEVKCPQPHLRQLPAGTGWVNLWIYTYFPFPQPLAFLSFFFKVCWKANPFLFLIVKFLKSGTFHKNEEKKCISDSFLYIFIWFGPIVQEIKWKNYLIIYDWKILWLVGSSNARTDQQHLAQLFVFSRQGCWAQGWGSELSKVTSQGNMESEW